ncbi:hypothetical protein OG625_22425 [Streptomyces sp. NBC_01351]|uniref:hypothetical protein n=1 Tax=Streptomyces sp. NBC_01351 TaxID=2903833 RepID=UPI002E33F5BB|nr:hypothetical protein [Streptomyces sp. NBC_01351]
MSEAPLVEIEARVCHAAWYAAALAANGRVGDFAVRSYPDNFHSATVVGGDGTQHVMLFHAHQPLVAFVTVRRYWYTDEFLEPPAWGVEALGGAGFVVLSAAELLSPLGDWDTSVLSPSELGQIEHWEPANLGAMLFNAWD